MVYIYKIEQIYFLLLLICVKRQTTKAKAKLAELMALHRYAMCYVV